MPSATFSVSFAPELSLFLPTRVAGGAADVVPDGVSTLGHVVESLGVPLPEVGRLVVDGRQVTPSHRPAAGERVEVQPVERPQLLEPGTERFLLDVHLGKLARRLRLLGLDVAYSNDASDDALVEQAGDEARVLLTQDRGLLRRRAVARAGYVRGDLADDQLRDVLDRFRPPLAPWTRCPACNGRLQPVDKAAVADLLEPGTRRTYDTYARCRDCGRVYWHGAHGRRLDEMVARAQAVVGDGEA